MAEKEAVNSILQSVTEYAWNRQRECHKAARNWWRDRRYDLGMALDGEWTFDFYTRKLRPPSLKEKTEEEKQAEEVA